MFNVYAYLGRAASLLKKIEVNILINSAHTFQKFIAFHEQKLCSVSRYFVYGICGRL